MTNAYESYLDSMILSADPVELVSIMYGAALDAVGRARVALEQGDILTRSRQITKTSEILNELALSLDHARGGDFSRNLAELYDYMQRRLIEANTRQAMAPLVEVAGLLTTLKSGWNECQSSLKSQTAGPLPAYAPHMAAENSAEYSRMSFTA